METWDAITSRRNVRDYRDEPLPEADLERVLEAARRAPSGRNLQPWDLILVTDRERLEALSRVWRGAGHIARAPAAVALIAPAGATERERAMIHYDLGQLTMQLMLAAADLGIGTGHASVEDQDLARRLLGFPADRVCAWLIGLGYPAGGPLRPVRRPDRRAYEDVVHRERF